MVANNGVHVRCVYYYYCYCFTTTIIVYFSKSILTWLVPNKIYRQWCQPQQTYPPDCKAWSIEWMDDPFARMARSIESLAYHLYHLPSGTCSLFTVPGLWCALALLVVGLNTNHRLHHNRQSNLNSSHLTHRRTCFFLSILTHSCYFGYWQLFS